MSLQIIEIKALSAETKLSLPFFLSTVQAGFPSPAEDYMEKRLDLNELLIKHPAATFFVRVKGESMREAGIYSGDILIVDRAVTPTNGKIIVAIINGEFTVKRIMIDKKGGVTLLAENAAFASIAVSPESDFQVWGVVTYVIHQT